MDTENTNLPEVRENKYLYAKTNALIFARFNMGKMEQQIIAYSLARLRRGLYEQDAVGAIEISFTSSEVLEMMGVSKEKRGSIGTELKIISNRLQGQKIYLEKENGDFLRFVMVKTCMYSKGEFHIIFHEGMTPYIKDFGNKFAIGDVRVLRKMTSGHTSRFYEFCEAYAYQARAHGGCIKKKYHFVELKLTLGLIDQDNPIIESLVKKHNRNYEKILCEIEEICGSIGEEIKEINKNIEAVSKSPYLTEEEKLSQIKTLKIAKKTKTDEVTAINKYPTMKKFTSDVLKKAKQELDELLEAGEVDVTFDFSTYGGRPATGYIISFLTAPGYYKKKEENRQYSLFDVPETKYESIDAIEDIYADETREEIDNETLATEYVLSLLKKEKVSLVQAVKIAEAGEYKCEEIKKAYDYMKSQSKPILKVVGYMIECLRNRYYENSPSAKIYNSFTGFQQNDYDFEQLEKDIVENQISQKQHKDT